MYLNAVLLLSACGLQDPIFEDSAGVADYALTLTPLVPLDGNPFEGVTRIDLLLDTGVGDPLRVTLAAPESGDSALAEGLPALDGTRIIVEGYAGEDLVAWGRSAPVTAVNGQINATIFISSPETIGQLGGLPEGDFDGAGAAMGDGRFVVMGGAGNRSGGSPDKTTDTVWFLDLGAPSEGLAFEESGTMPEYIDAQGDTQTKRRSFTLTRLTAGDAGKYLMVGGGPSFPYSDATTLTPEARLFDPETLTFEEPLADRDSLARPRAGHVALANQQGGVLVWGGTGASTDRGFYSPMPDGELYDPSKRAFTSISGIDDGSAIGIAMADLGERGTLVFGGMTTLDDGENSWRLNDASLIVSLRGDVTEIAGPRRMAGMAAIGLPDGDVAVFGGASGDGTFAQGASASAGDTVWRYRSSSDTWQDVGKLNVARAGHTATLLDNTHVLIAGGTTTWSPFDLGETALSCVEIYDVASDTSVQVQPCDEGDDVAGLPSRAEHPLALSDSEMGVIIVGGADGAQGAIPDASLYTLARPL